MLVAHLLSNQTFSNKTQVVRSINKQTNYDLSSVQHKALGLNNIISYGLVPNITRSEISQLENGKAKLNIMDGNGGITGVNVTNISAKTTDNWTQAKGDVILNAERIYIALSMNQEIVAWMNG